MSGNDSAVRAPRELNGSTAVAILVYLGLSLQLLQVGIIPLLPQIGEAVHSTPANTSWLVTASLLSGAVFLAVLSRLADLIGKKAVVLLALALVFVGSVIGCFVDSLGGLVLARVLMGAIMPMLALPEAIASDTMAPRRAQFTIGAIHSGTGAGISAGLLLGALAATGHASWRAYFVVGVIASLLGLVAVVAGVRDSDARAEGHLDVIGAILLALGPVGVLLAITEGPSWGWTSGRVLAAGLGGLVILAIWWVQQRRARYPLINVGYLLAPAVRLPYAITFLAAIGIYSALSAVTRLAQTPAVTGAGYGWSASEAAWYAVPQLIGSVLSFFVIRALVHRGRQVEALALGAGLLVVSFLLYGPLVAHAAGTLVALLVDSAGLALVLALTQIIILRSVPAEQSGMAVGLSIVMYAAGNSLGSAITGSLFAGHANAAGVPTLDAYRLSFLISGIAALVALAACWPLLQRARRAVRPSSGQQVPA
ncbi:MFS transporter [Nocardioides cheoyonin]|uniref:MFS transporter n=1 Tax=Nocardioides cheoyonin TaxID=3156615 RepID=UPI0032B3B272